MCVINPVKAVGVSLALTGFISLFISALAVQWRAGGSLTGGYFGAVLLSYFISFLFLGAAKWFLHYDEPKQKTSKVKRQ